MRKEILVAQVFFLINCVCSNEENFAFVTINYGLFKDERLNNSLRPIT